MNEVVKQLMEHRSIRKFEDKSLDEDTVKILVEAAQQASTSSFVQAYSIIGVIDPEIKQALRAISTQDYVEHNGHLFVFIADFKRHHIIAERAEVSIDDYFGATESFIVGTVDASLAAQNMAVAAESMGLGICYIGSLRNNMAEVIELLGLPDYTYPLFGMVVGYPAQTGSRKARLPFEHVYHENRYETGAEYLQQIAAYDEEIADYYRERTDGRRSDKWSSQVTDMLSRKTRTDVDGIVKTQGFLQQ
ncbi:oxygen-insensitive NADPH nitroreductase [Macrococcus equipercicus]|uniref:NADPH-dependent oxidoreductase n=1 Tax=Macrococcus equipercicus TaxID=69967 RepID=A0A9Q9F303_9STAP|nr:oxygen-insensitive NADPH nitroreductase [Macrococcus equipercicus]UTH13364.1 oxygen-insensitive NADPH nitroreductase [Macrococcus equipercicus]